MNAADHIHAALDVLLVDPTLQDVTLFTISRRIQLAMEARGRDMAQDVDSGLRPLR